MKPPVKESEQRLTAEPHEAKQGANGEQVDKASRMGGLERSTGSAAHNNERNSREVADIQGDSTAIKRSKTQSQGLDTLPFPQLSPNQRPQNGLLISRSVGTCVDRPLNRQLPLKR